MPKNNKPRILILDIETAPTRAAVWRIFKENVGLDQIENDWYILSFAAKWEGDSKVHYFDKSRSWQDDDDSLLLEPLRVLLDQADIVVAHNGRKFDCPKINARMIINGFDPVSPYRIVDTLDICKKNFAFTSNKLAYISKALGVEEKLSHTDFPGYKLWQQCLIGNKKAWKEMKIYNIQDVISLEQVYLKLRPWHGMHPNAGNYSSVIGPVCSKCGSPHLSPRGFTFTQVGKYQRFRCDDCGGWSRDRKTHSTKEQRDALLTAL